MSGFELDGGQAEVVALDRGAMLVTGAAGTGKSAALEERFVRLLEKGADPERTVLVAGSAGARDAVRRRILGRIRTSLPTLRILTIQGLANHVVSQRYASLRYEEPPEILPAADQFAKVHELLLGEEDEEWPAYAGLRSMRGFADQVRQFLTRALEAQLTPEQIVKR